jgi:hypothetical protein
LFPHAPVSSPDKTKASAPVFVEFTVTRAAQQAYRTSQGSGRAASDAAAEAEARAHQLRGRRRRQLLSARARLHG